MKTDILIIGGGIVGLAIANELAGYSLRAILLEKETEISFGVSKSNSGIIHTGFQSDPAMLKTRLAIRGNTLYKELAKALNFRLVKTGELVVAFPGEEQALEGLKKKRRDAWYSRDKNSEPLMAEKARAQPFQ